MGKRSAPADEEPGWFRVIVSALVQGLTRALADLLFGGRGGKGLF